MEKSEYLHIDRREFKEFLAKNSITRIEGTNIYKWNDFQYERNFFLEKFQEEQNKQ